MFYLLDFSSSVNPPRPSGTPPKEGTGRGGHPSQGGDGKRRAPLPRRGREEAGTPPEEGTAGAGLNLPGDFRSDGKCFSATLPGISS